MDMFSKNERPFFIGKSGIKKNITMQRKLILHQASEFYQNVSVSCYLMAFQELLHVVV